jgi:hypothetical protein
MWQNWWGITRNGLTRIFKTRTTMFLSTKTRRKRFTNLFTNVTGFWCLFTI